MATRTKRSSSSTRSTSLQQSHAPACLSYSLQAISPSCRTIFNNAVLHFLGDHQARRSTTNPLGRRSLRAALPLASFEAPQSCLPPHPKHQRLSRSARVLNRHRDTIAGSRIYLDDLLLIQFVHCTEDKSCKVRVVF